MQRSLAIVGLGLLFALSFPGRGMAVSATDRAMVVPASPEELRNREAVFSFLQDYFSALAQGEVEKLTLYHPSLSPEQLGTLRDYFAHTIRDLHIRLEHVRVNVVADRATVAFYRTDTFIDRPTGRSVEKSIELSTRLVQSASGWRLAGVDQIAFALVGNHTTIS